MKTVEIGVKRLLVATLLMLMCVGVNAQALRTGYFTDGYLMRYRLNPALMSTRGHFSIPVVGNFNMETMGNVGMGNFLYTSDLNSDKLVTFMHPSVSADDFLSGLDENNRVAVNFDMTILSTAFHAWGGFNSIDFTVHSATGISLPYDMLRFMKVTSDGEYNMGNINARTRNYADLSLGHARKINSSLTVGARLKLLLGLGYANAMFDNMSIKASADRWEIMACGNVDVAFGGQYANSVNNGKNEVDGYENIKAGINGYGVGLDLGAVYEFKKGPLDGLTLSASLNDLGYITWKKSEHASISADAPYVFYGFDNVAIHGNGNTLDDQWNGLENDLDEFFTIEDMGERSVTEGIGAKVNAAAEYEMPFYRRLSVGLLYTGCFDGPYSYNQGMLVVNISPLDVLDFAVSGRVGTYGAGFGAIANLHCPGFSLFVGTDCFLGKVSKEFIPLENMNSSISFGVNIALGKAKKK